LSPDHPKYDAAFANDDHSAHFPFITGPRQCPGREVARTAARLFISKTLWLYDLQVVKGQQLDYEKDFHVEGMWSKPELRFRMLPVNTK
jgi:cytochrome P450